MNIEQLRKLLPDYAKDIRINMASILTTDGSPDLTQKQILAIALSSAYATRNAKLISALHNEANSHLNEEEIGAAKSAATIMGMNNVYYRFTHAMQDKSYATMPAKLRMTVIANSGTDNNSFELNCLAVSAINGCEKCMNAHAMQLEQKGINKLAIQSAVRIASVVNAAALAIEII